MPNRQTNLPPTALRVAAVLLALLALLGTIWLLSDANIAASAPADSGPAISVEAFAGGYDAIMEELSATEPTAPSEQEPAIIFSLDHADTVFFAEEQLLELFSPKGGTIYYTLNGDAPDGETALPYLVPFVLEPEELPTAFQCAAIVLYDDGSYSDVYYRTYFVGTNLTEQFNIPIFSVYLPEEELWSTGSGIFHGNNINKRGRDWERAMNVQLFESDGTEVFNMAAGIRLYGAYSRTMVQKPMRFIARPDYDSVLDDFNTLDLFGELYDSQGVRIDRFEDLVLRNAGNDFGKAFMRDEIVQILMSQQGFAFTEPVRPCLVYINGTLYGLYWLHEPYKENYFENRFGHLDYQGEFVVLDGPERAKLYDGEVRNGFDPLTDYNEMLAYASLDLTKDKIYNRLCERLDVDSYLRMNASMVIVNNGDWPQNNNRVFKYFPAEGEDFSNVYGLDGKWYFVPHDTDWAFPSNANTNDLLRYFDPEAIQYSPLFIALMQREDCRQTYVTYFIDMLNGAFSAENIAAVVQGVADVIKPALELYVELSPYVADNFDMAAFERRYNRIISYATERCDYMLQYLDEVYDLGAPYVLDIRVPDGAGLWINTLENRGDFLCTYYENYTTTLRPIVPVGYVHEGWVLNGVLHQTDTLLIQKSDVRDGRVEVEMLVRENGLLFVSEISHGNGGDYITLYNPNSFAVSTQGYSLSDDANNLRRFALPVIHVQAGESLTVYCDNYSSSDVLRHLQAKFNLSTGETLYLTKTDAKAEQSTVIDSILLPKLQDGSIYVRDLYDGGFYEVLPQQSNP